MSLGSSVSKVVDHGLDEVRFAAESGIFLFTVPYRLALGPTHSPTQCLQVFFILR